jgi:5-hydroxyisourate hydrolase
MITTHVLDTALGKPARGVPIRLETLDGQLIGEGKTDDDGRLRTLTAGKELEAGTYRMRFDVAAYNPAGFYPFVDVVFKIDAGAHYHVPLLLSPYGYSTYRGS